MSHFGRSLADFVFIFRIYVYVSMSTSATLHLSCFGSVAPISEVMWA